MPFITIADLEARKDKRVIAQLSNDENQSVRVDAAVQAAIDDAYAEMVEVIGARTDGTDWPADGTLRRINAELAMFHLAARRPPVSEDWQGLHDKSMEDLAAYAARLGMPPKIGGPNRPAFPVEGGPTGDADVDAGERA